MYCADNCTLELVESVVGYAVVSAVAVMMVFGTNDLDSSACGLIAFVVQDSHTKVNMG